jgi:hypothetical protein
MPSSRRLAGLKTRVFGQRQAHVVEHAQTREQRPLLKQDADAPAQCAQRGGVERRRLGAEHGKPASRRRLQQAQRAQQHALAGAAAADQRQHLATLHAQPKVAMQHAAAGERRKSLGVDGDLAGHRPST